MDEIARYVLDLQNSLAAAQRADAEAAARRKVEESNRWRERLTPMPERLRALLTEIPPEVAAEGLSLSALTHMLRGKWRGHAHAGEVAAGLRELGWRRVRNWSDSARGFRAVWFPPLGGNKS